MTFKLSAFRDGLLVMSLAGKLDPVSESHKTHKNEKSFEIWAEHGHTKSVKNEGENCLNLKLFVRRS